MFGLSFSNNKNKKEEGVLIVDIGSGSVGAAISAFAKGGKPSIVYEIRTQFPIQQRLNNKRLMLAMIGALDDVINVVFKKGLSKLNKTGKRLKIVKIICTFSSPWHVTTTKSLYFRFEKPFILSPSFVSDVIEHESKNFVSSVARESDNVFLENDHRVEVVEKEILRTTINGYPVKYPIDREANEFEMILFLSALPHFLIKNADKILAKHFPDIKPIFHSLAGTSFDVFRKLIPNEKNFIVANIGGETTDISVVKNDTISETVSFPLGRNFIVRRLIDEVPGVTPDIALSMMRVESEGNSTPKLSQKLRQILSKAEDDWVELFADSMRDFSKNFFLPTKVFVLAGEGASENFANLITNRKLTVRGSGTPFINAEAISIGLLNKFVNIGEGETGDTFLATETFFCDGRYFNR